VKTVLVLAPHTDDAELGCGGTLSRLLEEGASISVAAFSTAQESLPPGAPSTLTRDEFLEAMRLLGVPREHVLIYDYPVRNFPAHRQALLEELVQLRQRIKPDTVFLPSASDIHQDHQVIAAEGLRAFKEGTVWSKVSVAVPRLRKAIRSGISFENELEYREDLIKYTLTLGQQIGLKYAFGFQFKLDCDGVAKVLECNPRLQGTMVASLFSGVNVIWMGVKEALGEPPETVPDRLQTASFHRFWGGVGIQGERIDEI
jgi:LmbE family N-acetylglucosaminyl deacetylase